MSDEQAKTPEVKPIHCEATGKLLARADASGIYLWCKACHCEHRITFTGTGTDLASWQEAKQHFLTTA
jgi:phage FluMu protein Com